MAKYKEYCENCPYVNVSKDDYWYCNKYKISCNNANCDFEDGEWYWFETRFRSLKDGLRNLLACNNIDYELSGSEFESWWHFEIFLVNDYQKDVIENWINENTITEKTA